VEAAERKGRPLPDWFLEEPELLPGDTFYLEAFWELSTCRSFGNGMGPIPWTAIIEYGLRFGLDDDMLAPFVTVIRAMDAEYVHWNSEEAKKAQAATATPDTGPVQRKRK